MPYISDLLYRILIINGSGAVETNVLLNLMKKQQLDIAKIHLYAKIYFLINESVNCLLIWKIKILNLFKMDFFAAADGWPSSTPTPNAPPPVSLPNNCHTHPTIVKYDTVYLT